MSEQAYTFDVEATMKVRLHLAGPATEAAALTIITNVLMQDPSLIRLFVKVDDAGKPMFSIVPGVSSVVAVHE